jgi:hypothetical protein
MRYAQLASLVALAWSAAAVAASMAPPKDIQDPHQPGQIHQNGCKQAGLQRIRKDVYRLAEGRAPHDAWQLIRRMLFGTTSRDATYVRSRTTAAIDFSENTASPDASYIHRSINPRQLNLVQMNAWSVHVQSNADKLDIAFSEGGVCSGGFTVTYGHSSWQISSAVRGCD